jgi:hypothetical protein
MDTAALIARTAPKINALGSAFYFAPETVAVGKEHGLDGFRFYILGRGGVLGDVEPAVVASAFGWWNGELIAKMWSSAKEKLSPREAGRRYVECCQALGRATLAAVPGLDAFCAAAEKVQRAADPAGLALFAGLAAEPLADDLPGRAMQLVATLRELRGSAHIVAVLATGLPTHLAHGIKRPDMYKSFGWGEQAPDVSDADRAKLDEAEVITDQLVTPAFSVLSESEADAFAAGIDAIEAALTPKA